MEPKLKDQLRDQRFGSGITIRGLARPLGQEHYPPGNRRDMDVIGVVTVLEVVKMLPARVEFRRTAS